MSSSCIPHTIISQLTIPHLPLFIAPATFSFSDAAGPLASCALENGWKMYVKTVRLSSSALQTWPRVLWSRHLTGWRRCRRVDHLGGAAGGVDQADRVGTDIGRIKGADEELIVGTVDWIAALEGQHIAPLRQRRAHLSRSGAREYPLRQLQALHLAACRMGWHNTSGARGHPPNVRTAPTYLVGECAGGMLWRCGLICEPFMHSFMGSRFGSSRPSAMCFPGVPLL